VATDLAATAVGNTLFTIGWIFLVLLLARLVFEYVFMFAREYKPAGVVLLVVEAVYTVTDPPLRLLRRFIPPLRIGQVAIDLSFMAVFLITYVFIYYVTPRL
jgi:YggT family protein